MDQAGFDMGQPHKHRDVIIAWANGEEIEFRSKPEREWKDIAFPCFSVNAEYRVKPKIVKREGWVNVYKSSVCTALVSDAYPSKESADINKSPDRLACIRIEWEEEV